LGMGDNAGALASAQRAFALATALGDLLLLAQTQMRLGYYHRSQSRPKSAVEK